MLPSSSRCCTAMRMSRAQRQLVDIVCGLLTELAKAGGLRGDVSPEELAQFCVHALNAAGGLKSRDAIDRLVRVTLSGLR